MTIYAVCCVPDYIGIDIIKIFKSESKALAYAAELNKDDYLFQHYGTETYFVDEFEVVEDE